MAEVQSQQYTDIQPASFAPPELGTKRFKPHLVLGDAQAYEQAIARASREPEQPAPQGLDAFDPTSVPKDIWDAANLVADRGVDIVRAYVHLTQERQVIRQQLEASFQRNSSSTHGATAPGTLGGTAATLSPGDTGRVAAGQLLSKATVEDYIRAGHDERVVQKWRGQLMQWAQVEADLMATTGKKQDELTLNRGEAWRHKQEVESSLMAAKLVRAEASTPAAWNMTLRGAHERYVMIGNIFSGLFLPVRESASPQMALTTVRRPSGPPTAPLISTITASRHNNFGPPGSSPGLTQQQLQLGTGSSSANGAAAAGTWAAGRHSERLSTGRSASPGRQERHSAVGGGLGHSMRAGVTGRGHSPLRTQQGQQQTLRQQQQQQQQQGQGQQVQGQQTWQQQGTHKPFAHVRGARQVEERGRRWEDSQYLEEAFQAVRRDIKDNRPFTPTVEGLEVVGQGLEDALWAVCQRDVGLADVEAFLVHADQQLLRDFQIARRAREAAEAAEAADAAAAAAKATARAAAQQLPKQGPHLEAATERLPFFCLPGCSSSAVLPVQNIGTAAVYYSWSSSAVGGPRGSSSGSSSSSGAAARHEEQRFYQPDQKGVILPGDSKEFSFTFKSQLPGTFSELWTLNTTPPLAGRGKRGPITVLLRGVAASADATSSARRSLEAELAVAERSRKVAAVLDAILRGLTTQPVLRPPCMQMITNTADATSSSSSNIGGGGSSGSSRDVLRPAREAERWMAVNDRQRPAVYYSPAAAAKLEALYGKAKAMLASEVAAVQAALVEAKKAKKKPDDPSLEQLPPDFPSDWDCSVDTLMSALAALDARQAFAPRQLAALLRKQAGAVLVEARQPDCRQRMVALACRRAIVDLATAVPPAAAAARALAYPNSRATNGGGASAAASHGSSHGKHTSGGGKPSASGGTNAAAPAAAAAQSPIPTAGGDAATAGATATGDAAVLYADTLAESVAEAAAVAFSQIEVCIAEQRAEVAAHLDGRCEAAVGQLRQLEEAGVDGSDDLVEEVAWRRFALLRAKQQLGCE